MPDHSAPQPSLPRAAPVAAKPARVQFFHAVAFGYVVVAVGGVAVVGVLGRLAMPLLLRHAVGASWAAQVVLSIGTLLFAWCSVRRRSWRFVQEVQKLGDLTEQARAGQLPIDQVECPTPHLVQLSQTIQQLLRDLKIRQQTIARLEAEMHTRVINRTDALERSIAGLRHQASRDGLTGLCNRRSLDDALPKLIEQCLEDRRALSILMIDVDNFKNLNDSLGHAQGDEMLKSIAQIIRSTVRDGDLACRCGGDEFVIVLPGCEKTAAERLAQRLTTLVDSLAKPLRLLPPVGLSIGVAAMSDMPNPSGDILLRLADEAAYVVKSSRKSTRPNAYLLLTHVR